MNNEELRDYLLFPYRMTAAIARGMGRMLLDKLGLRFPTPEEAQAEWEEVCRMEFPQDRGDYATMGEYLNRED